VNNITVICNETSLTPSVINIEEPRSCIHLNDDELLEYYAEATAMYARQIREIYLNLLPLPLQKYELKTSARMWSLTQELSLMTGLTLKKAKDVKSRKMIKVDHV
jgi:hypothetical protein